MTNKPGGRNTNTQESDQVIDFNTIREQRLEEKRKNTERVFFRDLLNVYSVTSHSQAHPVELLDVSEEGCAIQTPYDPENPWPKDISGIPLRLYFSQETYLEIFIKIKNSNQLIEKNNRYLRFGCTVDKDTQSYPAYQQFVRFLKLYSEQAHKDKGKVTKFYI